MTPTPSDAAVEAARKIVAEWECGCCPECERKMCEHSVGYLAAMIAAHTEAAVKAMRAKVHELGHKTIVPDEYEAEMYALRERMRTVALDAAETFGRELAKASIKAEEDIAQARAEEREERIAELAEILHDLPDKPSDAEASCRAYLDALRRAPTGGHDEQ